MTAESKSKPDPHKITPKQTNPNSKKKVRDLTDLFGGKLISIGKNKVDGQLGGDGRGSSCTRRIEIKKSACVPVRRISGREGWLKVRVWESKGESEKEGERSG